MIIYKFKKDPFSSHKRIADYIMEEKCKRVLDVGCNVGQLKRALKGWRGEIWGIDKEEEVINLVKEKYDRVFKIDVSREKFSHDEKFDAIVFGDILEHLENPELVINKFSSFLTDGGIMIISVPNIAHWFIRLSLLFGKFDYSNKGILDKTHLKFFTLKSITKIIETAGFEILRTKSTPLPLPYFIKATDYGRPLFFLHIINYAITKTRKSFFGYQFIFKCKLKRKNEKKVFSGT